MTKQQPSGSELRRAALHYHSLGLNILPLAGKQPFGPKWKRWQSERQTEEDVRTMPWESKKVTGIGAITGAVSDCRVCLDFDKAEGPQVLQKALVDLALPEDYPWAITTPGGGYHIWIRCPELFEGDE